MHLTNLVTSKFLCFCVRCFCAAVASPLCATKWRVPRLSIQPLLSLIGNGDPLCRGQYFRILDFRVDTRNVCGFCENKQLVFSVAYRYRKSISIIELFVSIISIYIGFLATNFKRSLSKFTGWAIIEELSIRGRVRRFLSSWGQRARVKLYNIDSSAWYEFWFPLICIDMNVISALSTTIQQ